MKRIEISGNSIKYQLTQHNAITGSIIVVILVIVGILVGCADRPAPKVPTRGEVSSVKQLLGDWDYSNAPTCSALDGLEAAINVAKGWDSDAELYEAFCSSFICDKSGPMSTSWVFIYSSKSKVESLAVAVEKQGAIASGFVSTPAPSATLPVSQLPSRLKKDTTNPFWHFRAVRIEDRILAVWVFAEVVRWDSDRQITSFLSWTDATTGSKIEEPGLNLATIDCVGFREGEKVSIATTIVDRQSKPLDNLYGTATAVTRGTILDLAMSFAGSSAGVGEKDLKSAGDSTTITRDGFLIWNRAAGGEGRLGAFFWDIGDSGLLEFYFPRGLR